MACRRSLTGVTLVAFALLATACADRQRRNPLDPEAEAPLQVASPLAAVAGDRQVRLAWNYTYFGDVTAVRLYRSDGEGDLVRQLAPADTALLDEAVTNGVTYAYRLSLQVAGEGERFLDDTVLATPGPEVVWLADGSSGLVWQISPDGRTARFARGRFYWLSGLAVNLADGSCWVSDGRTRGLYRISRDGEVSLRPARIGQPGDVSLDPAGRVGWVTDRQSRTVHSFVPDARSDSLDLVEVDASFEDPVSLAGLGDACWIADQQADRVLLYRRDGVRLGEWHGLAGPVQVVASTARPEVAWVLADEGQQVLRLAVGEPVVSTDLPFSPVAAIRADLGSGECWVLGPAQVAAVDAGGAAVLQLAVPEDGVDLAADDGAGHLWLARSKDLWKLAVPGLPRAQLVGFGQVLEIEVDPGR
ncbi:MAG: hypothetical protein ABIL09_23065 [Gemmatimonadota bacterium]